MLDFGWGVERGEGEGEALRGGLMGCWDSRWCWCWTGVDIEDSLMVW